MKILKIDDILVRRDRQRQEFDEAGITALMESIQSKGLLHAPIVAEAGDGQFELIAGERRLRAISLISELELGIVYDSQDIPVGHVPVTLLSDLSELSLREVEFEENEVRVNLSWQERTHALAELHELRSLQAAAAGTVQTLKATASEVLGVPAVGSEISKVSDAVSLAKHLDDPEVAAAKSQKEALKIVKKKAEAAHRAELAKTFDLSKTPHKCIHGDSLVVLQSLPAESVDCFVTDPPYGINADQFGDMASTGHAYKDTPEYAIQCYTTLATEAFRIGKPQCVIYAFCDFKLWGNIVAAFRAAGWEVWPKPLIWFKSNGMLPKPEFGPRYTYEVILFATKGQMKVKKQGAPDVICIPNKIEVDHGAQKPVALYEDLLSRHCLPGSVVCDPFAGSGPIFPAANGLKLTAIAIELSEKNYNLCLSRMTAKELPVDVLDI